MLAERGQAASMSEVAEAAGVGRATLYRHFPSREALLAALADTALREAGEHIRQAKLDAVPVEEATARLARALITVGSHYMVLVRSGASVDKSALARECREPMQALFARGQASGELRDDLPVEWLEKLFVSALLSGLSLAAEGGLGVEETAASVVSLFLDGARGRRAEAG